MARGFTRTDLAALVAVGGVLGAVGVSLSHADPSGRTERLIESLANLRAQGVAIGQYRADNAGKLPLELTTSRRRPPANDQGVSGWAAWQYGGKNCSAFWFNYAAGAFDVEAADRPLNAYLYPDRTFFAPPPPARLAVNDPARLNQQARVFRDPADGNSHQRNWPNPNNPPISAYDDVGTSYGAQMDWMEQLEGRVPGGLVGAFREGCRRLAVDQGVDPSRFLHVVDPIGDIVLYSSNPLFQAPGNHGGMNQGVSLYADGHAALITYRPGMQRDAKINAEYSVWFEDLGRPAGRTPEVQGGR